MARRYAPEELQRIFEKMAGAGLWISQRRGTSAYVGPAFAVYLKYSDLFPDCGDVSERYWRLLQEVPTVNAIGVLATINNMLATTERDQDAHLRLQREYVEPQIAQLVIRNSPAAPAFGVVFHRLGCALLMRDLLLYGANRDSSTNLPITRIGTAALCANEFVDRDPPPAIAPTNLELAAQFVGTWDVYNSRDLAYAMTRMHYILTEILPKDDPEIATQRNAIGMNSLMLDGLALSEFVAIAFALFAYGNPPGTQEINRVLIDPAIFMREFPGAQPLLDKFLAGRALTVEQMTDRLSGGEALSHERFLADTRNKGFLIASLAAFRQHPLLRLSNGHVLILDRQFLTELVTTGLYWLLFDNLPKQCRDAFKELWGHCFEDYVVDLLRGFYPSVSQILHTGLEHENGEIDALLDFGLDVIVIEIKSSLLTEAAKRNRDHAKFSEDVNRKFVRNEKGAPKAVAQLARTARAVVAGNVDTAMTPNRIYPVLITDEPACESLAFNAYLNERFQDEMTGIVGVRPLTVMSVNECEELLPYAEANAFSWAELLETRFVSNQVNVWSIHQAIYDWRHSRNMNVYRNDVILKRFKAVFEKIRRTFGVAESPS